MSGNRNNFQATQTAVVANLENQTEPPPPVRSIASTELRKALAEVKGQTQFLLYLADQIEDSIHQLEVEPDASHSSFLCKLLGMYTSQLELKHQGLGEKISETCQQVFVSIQDMEFDREF